MSRPRVLAIIPARGGSKRVPHKNLRLIAGKPLLSYTIKAAQESKNLTAFAVSTDSVQIAHVAIECGAYVIKRPEELAQDDSTTGAVLRHALDWMGHDDYDMLVCLHPTSPIRDPRHIDQAIELLWASELDYLASVQRIPRKGHVRTGVWTHGEARPVRHGRFDAVDCDLWLNASIYAIKVGAFLDNGLNTHVWPQMVALVMDKKHSLDINDQADLILAEHYLGNG